MYPRIYNILKNKSFFLFGPRSTGKTTWLNQVLPEAVSINLLHTETARRLLASPSRLEEMDGASLETLFFQHYRALAEFSHWDQELSYWRTASGEEIDFVSYGSAGLFVFEIQRTPLVKNSDLDSLKLFIKDYPMAKAFFLYGGTERIFLDGVECIGFEEGLKKLPDFFGVKVF